MKEIKIWQAFDGIKFTSEEECKNYENNHILYNLDNIRFYSDRGKLINKPCEHVFLDSNRFEVNNQKSLESYITYCKHLGIIAPHIPPIFLTYPLHFRFTRGKWECIEERLAELEYDLRNEFNSNLIEEDIPHKFAECDNY